MPDLVVTIQDDWLTIDGPLPDGYRLIVHNHSGNIDYYPYMEKINACKYSSPVEEAEADEEADGNRCYLYVENSPGDA